MEADWITEFYSSFFFLFFFFLIAMCSSNSVFLEMLLFWMHSGLWKIIWISLAFPSVPFLLMKLPCPSKHTAPSVCLESPGREEVAGLVGWKCVGFWISALELNTGFWEEMTCSDKCLFKNTHTETCPVSAPCTLKAQAQINLHESDTDLGPINFAEINKRTRTA